MNRMTRVSVLVVLAMATPRYGLAQAKPAPTPSDLMLATLRDLSLTDLMNITITTATRRPEGAADVPARVQVVTAAQIQARGYRSLTDVLKDLADFKVDLAGDPDYPTQLTVQGSRGASRVVILLDGIRITSPTGEPLPIVANYPVHNARQIEIVYGPSSALYGADAFSAVINIISKNAIESSGLMIESSAGQFGLTNQTGTYARRLGTRASLVVSGQALFDHQPDLSRFYPADFQGLAGQHSGTFNTLFGPETPSARTSADYNIPLSAHSVNATLRAGGLQVMFFENRSRVSTSAAFTPDNTLYNDTAFLQNTLVVGAGSYTRTIGRVTSLSTLTMSRHEQNPQSGYANLFTNMERSYKYAYGTSTRADEQLSWKPTAAVTLTTGASFERFFSIPQTADLNAPIVSRDVPGTILGTTIVDDFIKLRYANTGAYFQLQYAIGPKVVVTLGSRGDYNTRYGATFNPRAGLVAHLTPDTTLKVLYGTAYLAPTPFEENAHWGTFASTDGGLTYASDYWHVPNPDLKPQRKQTFETNVVHRLGSAVSLSASAFVSRATDLIKSSDDVSYAGTYLGWPVTFINFGINDGQETIYGGTIGLEALKSFGPDRRIGARVGISMADGLVRNENSFDGRLQLGGMSPVQLRLGADVEWDQWTVAPRLAVVGTQRLIATADLDPNKRRTLPGYAVVDVTVRRRHLIGPLGAFVTIENALDARYRNINVFAYSNPEELIGAPQNPRRITAGFDLRIR